LNQYLIKTKIQFKTYNNIKIIVVPSHLKAKRQEEKEVSAMFFWWRRRKKHGGKKS